MDPGGCVAATPPGTTSEIGQKGAVGFFPRRGRQRFFSGCFWGAHTGPNPTDRGKNGCKRHVIVDGNGVPLAVKTTPANVLDGKEAIPLLDAIPAVDGERGRPRRRPMKYLGDRGYGWQSNIDATRARRVEPMLARPKDNTHGSGLGVFRVVVEHAMSWFNQSRRLRVCYERTAKMLQGFHHLAAALMVFKRYREVLK
jgi:Transposase DDE domain.